MLAKEQLKRKVGIEISRGAAESSRCVQLCSG